jgi:glycosyltransferase involved in cell wall biosynthesis
MRILLVTHYFSTHAGGIEIVAGAIAGRLAPSHTVVWAASDCDPPPADVAPDHLRPMHSLNFLERMTGLPFPLWGPRSLAALWHEVKQADVVHLHDFTYFGNWAAFAFARILKKPVLITQHIGFIPYRNAALRGALRLLHHTAGRLMLGSAEQVVFISPVVQSYFDRFVTYRSPPRLVWNGVDTSTYVPASPADRAQARVQLGLDSSRPVVLFVGRFVERKGLALIERLARRMPDVTWTLAGWGPIDPRQWNGSNVQVFSGRSGASLVPLYHAADLLVLPSVGEGLPLVIQEAMSCGTPVVVGEDTARAIQAPDDLVVASPVTATNAEDAWGAAVRQMLARPDREDLQARVAAFARTRWSWETCVAAYAAMFARLTSTT